MRATEAVNETLEAAVAERTEHLLAAHEKLRHSASIVQSTFNGMAEAVLVVDLKGEVLLSNPAAKRLLNCHPGMNVEQLRTQNILFQADGTIALPARDRPVDRAVRGEQFDGHEVVLRQPNRRDPLHILVSSRPLHDASGAVSGAALVYHDITASRETEHKLQQSQKLDAIGKLTGGVAHDFNNMLTVITGTTDALADELKDRPDLLSMARQIDRAAERCTELIQHLLAFARKQPLQPRNVDINAAVVEIAKLLAADARRADRDRDRSLEPQRRDGAYRCVAAGQFAAQHGDQRPRRDAERRQARAGDPACRARRCLCQGQSRTSGPVTT